jgi:hypothetical protein
MVIMDKAVKIILNLLRCPVCQSQIDLIDWATPKAKSTSYNFGCAAEYEHYKLWFPHWDSHQISYDVVKVYEGRYRYTIMQRYPITTTSIECQQVDAEHRILERILAKEFKYNKILFDWPKTNREKIVNRVKTILTFQ